MAQTKVKDGLLNFPDRDDFIQLPSGTTAQRPSSPSEGYIRFNTTIDKIEFFDGVRWVVAGETPPTLTSVDYPGNALAADVSGGETILINGTNFASGISVTIGTTDVAVVTLNSPTQLAITSPVLTAGDYDVKVTNLDGGTITALDFISYNGVPSWVTASGSLGSLNFGEAISTITLSATEPDSGTVTYAITSGALPVGLTLSSSGEITGTMPSGSSETTYSFTVTATDDENQSTDRSFTITGVVPFVPSQHFNTVLYTGTGATNPVTGVGFQPDMVWAKSRSTANWHMLCDSVRGLSPLFPNGTDTEGGPVLVSYDSDGFTTTSNGTINGNGNNMVSWNFKAGGAAVSNTDGTITSQVSANPAAGFSIVSYTDNASYGRVGHGLGVAPSVIIEKRRDSTSNWVYLTELSTGWELGVLNDTAAFTTNFTFYDGVNAPNDTTFRVGNPGGANMIAYCFAEVEGFSNFGSYVGTGASGNTVVTGFEPAFVMFKGSSINSEWGIFDNKRDNINPNTAVLLAQSSGSEAQATGGGVNFLSNGFQLNDNNSNRNSNGETYIYMAFAADPNTQVPTKADSFNTVTWTGNSTNDYSTALTQSVTGVGFEPDLVWIKNRNNTYPHGLFDNVRGATKLLQSMSNGQEIQSDGYLKSFDTDGFGLGGDYAFNRSGYTYVAWNWKAGGTPSINTDGSITSVVSANKASGFSIVSYTGNSIIGSTVGHGLDSAPDVVIYKGRESGLPQYYSNWGVYHSALGATQRLWLQTTGAAQTASGGDWINNTEPTDSVFTVGEYYTNWTGRNFIAYCFAEVAGFSKFGSYTGTGASQTIVTGFEPAFVMIKRATGGSLNGWVLSDNKRGAGINLFANTSGIEGDESAYGPTSFTSNGFTLAQEGGNTNTSGSTYIYMAFANQF